jgi:predicted nucleotidyltransferase
VLDAAALLRSLNERGVEYVVVGGLAMVTHGSAHVTEDLDVCYNRTPANLAALAAALAPVHPYLRGVPPGLPFRLDAVTLQAGLNFTLVTDLGPLDLMGEIAGVGTFQEVFAQSEEFVVAGLPVRVLSLDAPIASKKAAGAQKDRLHLQELEELKKLRDTPS